MRPFRLPRRGLPALLLALLLGACARESSGWTWSTPEVVDEATLRQRLAPREEGELVLANFWASW